MEDLILGISIILAYIAFGAGCAVVSYKKGEEYGEKLGYRKGMRFVCDEIRKIIKEEPERDGEIENGKLKVEKLEIPNGSEEAEERADKSPPVAIGDEVYAVLCPFDECDPPAYIEAYRVYGVGVTKDGKQFIINEDMEHFMLDDEDDGLAFSTRERAEKFLKKYIKSK